MINIKSETEKGNTYIIDHVVSVRFLNDKYDGQDPIEKLVSRTEIQRFSL